MFSISITDDHAIVRDGIKKIFTDNQKIEVTGSFGADWELFEAISNKHYDLHIIDVNLAGISGIDAIKYIKKQTPTAKILVFSMYDKKVIGSTALMAGADWYLEKHVDAKTIVSVVEELLSTSNSMEIPENRADNDTIKFLSKREVEIFKLTAEGKTNSYIATELKISIKTVNTYRARMKQKLKIKSSRDLIARYTDNLFTELLVNRSE